MNAVILHDMDEPVKDDRRAQRRAETERRLVVAAAALFVERGYAATTLAAVATEADIAPRTLYLHFATKAELLLRCIGAAIAGDATPIPIPIAERPAITEAMTAETLDERLRLMTSFTASLMERTGPLLEVAFQAAPTEPSIEAAAAAGRADTARTLREFWHRIDDDGLLPPSVDLAWLTETATLVAHAETYLLLAKTTKWDVDTYRDWLTTTWRRLAAVGSEARGVSRARRKAR
jgi:AcrR family transcriptional regulator